MATVRSTPPELSAKDIKRFWSKVQKGPGCWLWTGGTSASGYGQFKAKGKNRRAHRIAVLLATGKWPEWPALAMHNCDIPLCCRYDPEHVQYGTLQENRMDCERKKRHAHGETNGRARLTAQDVLDIRARLADGISQMALGNEYGISHSTVWYIAHNLTWKHMP